MPALRFPTEKPNPSSLLFLRTISKKATTGWHARQTARGRCNICFSALAALSGFAVVRFSTPAASSGCACCPRPSSTVFFPTSSYTTLLRFLRRQWCRPRGVIWPHSAPALHWRVLVWRDSGLIHSSSVPDLLTCCLLAGKRGFYLCHLEIQSFYPQSWADSH